jgi:PAS domain S-box-containing protein
VSEHRQNEESTSKAHKWLNASMLQAFESLNIHYYAGEILCDENGKPYDIRYSDVSPSLLHLIGKSREEWIGKTRNQIFGLIQDNLMENLGAVVMAEQPSHFQNYDGTINRLCDSFAWKLDIGHVACVTKDITEFIKAQEALRESEQKYKHIVKFAPTGIYEIDFTSGTIVSVNDAFCQYIGYTEQELLNGQIKPKDLLDKDSNQLFADRIKKVLKGEKLDENVVYRGQTRDGRVFWTQLQVKIFTRDGKPHGLVVAHDVTESKKAEEALKERTKELELTEEKLSSKSVQLEKYATNMEILAEERARKLRDSERLAAIGATAGMVGHDIRNPLQAIVGDIYLLNDFLADMPEGKMKQEVSESLENIGSNISYINKIVADLQDYARPIKPEIKNINVNDLVTTCIHTITVPDEIKASLSIDSELWLRTDETLLRRIISNLVNNAIQAMPKGGSLLIGSCKGDNKVSITVEDSGVGIPESVKEKMFTPMMTTKSKGQGLGLAVVKRLVEALGGTISFESKEGKGTTFRIELPTQ